MPLAPSGGAHLPAGASSSKKTAQREVGRCALPCVFEKGASAKRAPAQMQQKNRSEKRFAFFIFRSFLNTEDERYKMPDIRQ
jgi:hypothetical protein